jgi:phage repressor protein C with HTH and peptisase S24 domain
MSDDATHMAFRVRMASETMSPRFKVGEAIVAGLDEAPRPGDDVVFQTASGWHVRELLALDADSIVVRQYRPQIETTIRRDDIVSMHRVLTAEDF